MKNSVILFGLILVVAVDIFTMPYTVVDALDNSAVDSNEVPQLSVPEIVATPTDNLNEEADSTTAERSSRRVESLLRAGLLLSVVVVILTVAYLNAKWTEEAISSQDD